LPFDQRPKQTHKRLSRRTTLDTVGEFQVQ
jgi:hypothetical protein